VTIEEIHALNREMIAAGARKFACRAPSEVREILFNPNSK
jgi:hypothetical protein